MPSFGTRGHHPSALQVTLGRRHVHRLVLLAQPGEGQGRGLGLKKLVEKIFWILSKIFKFRFWKKFFIILCHFSSRSSSVCIMAKWSRAWTAQWLLCAKVNVAAWSFRLRLVFCLEKKIFRTPLKIFCRNLFSNIFLFALNFDHQNFDRKNNFL